MSKHLDKAIDYRTNPERMYSCSVSVLLSFSDVTGLTEEQSIKVASCFAGGLKRGETCGAICGGLMVMGLLGIKDQETVDRLFETIEKKNEGYTRCKDLLAMVAAKGEPKKPHCNEMVYDVVRFLDALLEEKGD